MSNTERIEALERASKDTNGRAKVEKEHVNELQDQTEALNIIFGDSYVDMLRQLQEAVILILDYLFQGDPKYVKFKKSATISPGKDLGNN